MSARAYYNENDAFAAQWLRNLIGAGHIAPGDVDERSIVDVRPNDLTGYTQCHFFAGIGGWSVALRLAGWPDDRPVWTGSCPCQPFSAAGAGKAFDDQRHLWPAWLPLIAERRPAIVFGEQVEAAIGWGWLDLVFADLEGEGYACGASVLPACGVGAPHIRQRTWFVADAGGERRQQESRGSSANEAENGGAGRHGGEPDGHHVAASYGADGRMADASEPRSARRENTGTDRVAEGVGNANSAGLPQRERDGQIQRAAMEPQARQTIVGRGDAGFWADLEWLPCTDGKARPIEPGSFPLAHGVQRRTSKLRAYGNAIVPQVAAQFIGAYLDIGQERATP